MRALVLEGGAMRGIFTAGVLDALAARAEPPFDVVIGVSSGAYCASSYLAGQHGRIQRIIRHHMTGWNYANPYRMLVGGSLIDQDVLMEVTRRHDPLDVETLRASPSKFEVVATHAATGAPSYLPASGSDCLNALHATGAVPFFYRGGPIRFRREDYFDGSVSDPLPVGRAIELGATDVAVIHAHPEGEPPGAMPPMVRFFMRRVLARYPAVAEAIANRHRVHEAGRRLIEEPPPGVAMRTVAPPPGFPVSKFTRDPATVLKGYEIGYETGARSLLA